MEVFILKGLEADPRWAAAVGGMAWGYTPCCDGKSAQAAETEGDIWLRSWKDGIVDSQCKFCDGGSVLGPSQRIVVGAKQS